MTLKKPWPVPPPGYGERPLLTGRAVRRRVVADQRAAEQRPAGEVRVRVEVAWGVFYGLWWFTLSAVAVVLVVAVIVAAVTHHGHAPVAPVGPGPRLR